MLIRYVALPTNRVQALREGALDDYGMKPERRTSDGAGVPCRHCLRNVEAGKDYLIQEYFEALALYTGSLPPRFADHPISPATVTIARQALHGPAVM